ncbi:MULTISPECIES: hypothetical protein [Thermus]|jgi:hypothetical protein|uniref:Uncharacterized protein n=1 Tax=Thermus brockianus TaxID=56956 RepID=A0A1J0LQD1_THEBO|nr:hypothetical protein [Thermus brockianus]APD08250.1 hypothetical protein A0O31_00014 [Thermus brockianus]
MAGGYPVFNGKSPTSWPLGWCTTVGYAGIRLAEMHFNLVR